MRTSRFNKYIKRIKFIFYFLIVLNITTSQIGFLFSNNQIQGISIWTEDNDHDFFNGTLNNVSIIGTGESAELILNNVSVWTNKTPINKPMGRYQHAMANLYGTYKSVLFGGWGEIGGLNGETWIYCYRNNTWKQKFSINTPSRRAEHAMSTIYGTKKALLFGGYAYVDDITNIYDNKTWIYDYNKNDWIDMNPIDEIPEGRLCHAMSPIYGTDKVLLFGGVTLEKGNCDDTWVYDLSDNQWLNKTTLIKPVARNSFSLACISGTDKVLLYGGGREGHRLDDTWVYDFGENTWCQMFPKNNPGELNMQAMTSIENTDKIVLFGGAPYNNITWIYDFSDNIWVNITLKINPSLRIQHTMTTIFGTDKIILFGGSNCGTCFLNDTWIFELPKYVKTGFYVSSPFQIGLNLSLKKLIWCANISINTSIKFQLRSAISKIELKSSKFVGPDGNEMSFYTTLPCNIWQGHKYDSWIQYKAFFYTKNRNETPRLKSVNLTYNYWSNPVLINPQNQEIISNNQPTFNWNFTDPDSTQQSVFQVLIDRSFGSDNKSWFDSGEQNSSNSFWKFPFGTEYSVIPDGHWFWKVRTKDNDGDWGLFCEPFEFTIDSTPPKSNIIFPINHSYYRILNSISGKAIEPIPGIGIKKVEIIIKRISDNYYWTGSKWNLDETWLLTRGTTTWLYNSSFVKWSSGEKYKIQSRAIDNITNLELPSYGIEFFIDMDYPVSEIEFPINNSYLNSLNTISGKSYDIGGSGLNSVKISIKQNNNNTFWNGYDWISDEVWLIADGNELWNFNTSGVNWTTDTYYTIRSCSIDNVSNKEIPGQGITFMYDNKSPDISILIDDNATYTNSQSVILSLNAKDSGSGVTDVAYSSNNITWSFWEVFTEIKHYELHPIDGEKIVYYRVKDRANNTAISQDIIILDMTPPHSLSILINKGEKKINITEVTLELHALDNLSGVSQMSFSNDGKNWSDWENYSNIKVYNLITGNGEKKIYFRARDHAKNIANPVFDTILLNTTNQSIDFDNGHPSNEKEPSEKNDTTWLIVGIAVVIIIIIIILLFFLLIKRKKKVQVEQKSLPEDKTEIEIQQQMSQQPQQHQIQPTIQSQPSQQTAQPQQPLIQPTIQPITQPQEPQIQPTIQPQQPPQKLCSTCGQGLTYYSQNNKYYCYQCQKYE